MKELSIEEKAKCYDEAIKRAKNFIENGDERERTITESIFAGIMEESEDEKIRKALIEYFNEQCDMSDWNGVYGYQVVSWLEKQGNLMSALQEANKKIGELIEENYNLREQKPAWSEEVQEEQVGEEFINALGTMLNDGLPDRYLVSEERIKKSAELLFSIARKQLKNEMQEWSEEDEDRIKNILSVLDVQVCWDGATGKKDNPYQKEINWLKSLRPQNRWKPSDEQMLAINTAIGIVGKYTLSGQRLEEVLEQLKTL